MLNNYYYRSIISQWIWEIFEEYLHSNNYVAYKLKVSQDNKTYVECYGGNTFSQKDVNNISTLTGLQVYLPNKVMKLDGTDLVNYDNYCKNSSNCIIIIDDPYFVISSVDKNSSAYEKEGIYDEPYCFYTEHFKVLSKKTNFNAKHERTFVDQILLGLYSSYSSALNQISHCLHTTNPSRLICDLKELKEHFKITIEIPNRYSKAMAGVGTYYKYVDLSKISFLLGLHNIEVTSTLSDHTDPIKYMSISLPIDNEAIDVMCEAAESDFELVKSSLTNFDISFMFKDELHKKLFANKNYFKVL